MAEHVWKDLQRWRAGHIIDATTTTKTTLGEREEGDRGNHVHLPQLPRSFRPHRIVPHVYVGALNDVHDTWALRQRLMPDELLLLISACGHGEAPTLELRELIPPTASTITSTLSTGRKEKGGVTNGKDDNRRVRRLALCSWDKLKEYVIGINATYGESSHLHTARWLQQVLETRSFAHLEERVELTEKTEMNSDASSRKPLYFKLLLPWQDEPSFPVIQHFSIATTLMRAVVEGLGKAVVCYCMAGRSRSVTLICAFLLQCCCARHDTEKVTREWRSDASISIATNMNTVNNTCRVVEAAAIVKVVLSFVQEARSCACPNVGFIQQLQLYARELLCGEEGRENRGYEAPRNRF